MSCESNVIQAQKWKRVSTALVNGETRILLDMNTNVQIVVWYELMLAFAVGHLLTSTP